MSNKEVRDPNSYAVYFLEEGEGDWIKVGICSSIYDRVRTLNQGRPLNDLFCKTFIWCNEKDNNEVESLLHKLFEAHFKRDREWFEVDDKDKFFLLAKEALKHYKGAKFVDLDKDRQMRGSRGRVEWNHYPKGIEELKQLAKEE